MDSSSSRNLIDLRGGSQMAPTGSAHQRHPSADSVGRRWPITDQIQRIRMNEAETPSREVPGL
jgi:hypothetical protein